MDPARIELIVYCFLGVDEYIIKHPDKKSTFFVIARFTRVVLFSLFQQGFQATQLHHHLQ